MYMREDQREPPRQPAAGAAVDFAELDEAYENVATSHRGIVNRQQLAVREVLGNLNEADSPTIGDEISKTLATMALAYASGGISTAIAAKLTTAEETILNAAIQSGLDDGFKDAVATAVARYGAAGGSSKATFFASQEEALETSKELGEKNISAGKKAAKAQIGVASQDAQPRVLAAKVAAAKSVAAQRAKSAETARQIQYQESLSKWMTAMARGSFGEKDGGTNVRKGMDMSPAEHYKKRGIGKGVVYIAFGQRSAAGRPFSANSIRVAGITDAARQRIKDTPIRDLDIPIIATGYVYDGFWDGVSIGAFGDNEISLGKNEGGTVWSYGHTDALEALKKAGKASSANEAARIILDEDLGRATLASAHLS